MTQKEQAIISPMPTDALLHEREVAWRVKLPDDYKEFIKKENGIIPSKRYFHFGNNEKVIDRFLAILAISGEKTEEAYDIGVVSTQLEGRIVFDEDNVGMQLIPIAALYGGDFLCLNYVEDPDNPNICIWYHEESYELEPAIEFLANNFTEFLAMLY
ncbi:SMI1/KNR4 family protein [Streptococcus oralis]|uniref:SMI1/KNR4 family protein n=1 Tax=Streptococcus oralis subsp. oralis TaxID=1891914 RepID=A0A1X1IFD3_STROR|nr:SMI1/KNR4 family protein [Streptococcus oralis]MCY7074459.1 SMI1/KNR4 family protein [Streptococcus oralis]ORO47635.1 SMI1/KNR4 family protein [Streptococcus oralis subsp. oralis]ORO69276.1 SMI1/KNR4 family protein [Streptococcus oralis subsp. oralis]ORO71791.1 SMI1/KNR4 family protein [Streptococcus oralis subsp. oralis]ORO74693.1 SMI1/KNR4 family protein [Streptococcus oralis subsp. oralis]